MRYVALTPAVAVAALLFTAAPARTELRLVGEGKNLAMDPRQFDDEQRARYDLFKVRCTKCHPMARPIAAITKGVTPVTGSPFNQAEVKKYVVKMMRKPNSGISREDAKEILVFLRHALERAGHKRSDAEDEPGSGAAGP